MRALWVLRMAACLKAKNAAQWQRFSLGSALWMPLDAGCGLQDDAAMDWISPLMLAPSSTTSLP